MCCRDSHSTSPFAWRPSPMRKVATNACGRQYVSNRSANRSRDTRTSFARHDTAERVGRRRQEYAFLSYVALLLARAGLPCKKRGGLLLINHDCFSWAHAVQRKCPLAKMILMQYVPSLFSVIVASGARKYRYMGTFTTLFDTSRRRLKDVPARVSRRPRRSRSQRATLFGDDCFASARAWWCARACHTLQAGKLSRPGSSLLALLHDLPARAAMQSHLHQQAARRTHHQLGCRQAV